MSPASELGRNGQPRDDVELTAKVRRAAVILKPDSKESISPLLDVKKAIHRGNRDTVIVCRISGNERSSEDAVGW